MKIVNQFSERVGDDTLIFYHVETKYGLCKIRKSNWNIGKRPCIRSALDKNGFISNRFREIHGDKYDYSLVEYINNFTNVKIICSVHGIFLQTPANHLIRHGCIQCSKSKEKVIDSFKRHQKIMFKLSKLYGINYLVNFNKLIKLNNLSINYTYLKSNKGIPVLLKYDYIGLMEQGHQILNIVCNKHRCI